MKDLKHRKQIGARIAEIRNEKGITAVQLAEMIGLTQPNISRIEQGKYSTGIDILGKIADALGCTIDFIQTTTNNNLETGGNVEQRRKEMKNYEDYKISWSKTANYHYAFKYNAASVKNINFSHHFYFQRSNGELANCTVNGRMSVSAKPACGWGGENYYQSHDFIQRDGKSLLILSPDMKKFYVMDQSLDYFNLEPIEL